MQNLFEIHPKRPISGILPNRKRLDNIMTLTLSRAEFLRCMQNGTVYAILKDKKVLVTETDWDKATALFNQDDKYNINPLEPAIIGTDISIEKDHTATTQVKAKMIEDAVDVKIVNPEKQVETVEEESVAVDAVQTDIVDEAVQLDTENESEEAAVNVTEEQQKPVLKNDLARNFSSGKNNKNKNNKNNQKR